MSKLHGKVALVTGGTTGIGLATVCRFHAEGARVFATGRNPKTLAEARKALPADVTLLQADSANLSDLDRLVAEVRSQAGHLDILFVNAGIGAFLPLEAVDKAHWDAILGVNLKGPFFLAQKALPLLRPGASIVFTTSVVGQKGIRVNSVAPGPITTPIDAKLGLPQEALSGFESGLRQRVPLQRFGADEEVAKAVLFLASEDGSFITGEELVVDGGLAVA
jgi:NAD(P)-dependent dehydrogenase (short-subunit alcohol dehydrogenase family)